MVKDNQVQTGTYMGRKGPTETDRVQIARSDAQLHNLHVEQHKYEQCSILLVIMHNYAMHNTHLMHNIVLLCTCAYIFHFLNNYAQFVVHVLYIKWKIVHKCTIAQQTCTMQTNHALCLALCRFVLHSCAWLLCISCNCCALFIVPTLHYKH